MHSSKISTLGLGSKFRVWQIPTETYSNNHLSGGVGKNTSPKTIDHFRAFRAFKDFTNFKNHLLESYHNVNIDLWLVGGLNKLDDTKDDTKMTMMTPRSVRPAVCSANTL